MYRIRKAEKLADKIYLMDVEAPRVAKHCEPGQFVIVKIDEKESAFRLRFVIITERKVRLRLCFRPSEFLRKRWRNLQQEIISVILQDLLDVRLSLSWKISKH